MLLAQLFAQINEVPAEFLKNVVLTLAGAGVIAVSVKKLFGKVESVISPQPLNVEVVKALHEQFAGKREFEDHVKHNTERHGQIFNNLNRVESEAREYMDRKLVALNEERRATMEKLDAQFVFIRENIAAINRELQIRNR